MSIGYIVSKVDGGGVQLTPSLVFEASRVKTKLQITKDQYSESVHTLFTFISIAKHIYNNLCSKMFLHILVSLL